MKTTPGRKRGIEIPKVEQWGVAVRGKQKYRISIVQLGTCIEVYLLT